MAFLVQLALLALPDLQVQLVRLGLRDLKGTLLQCRVLQAQQALPEILAQLVRLAQLDQLVIPVRQVPVAPQVLQARLVTLELLVQLALRVRLEQQVRRVLLVPQVQQGLLARLLITPRQMHRRLLISSLAVTLVSTSISPLVV